MTRLYLSMGEEPASIEVDELHMNRLEKTKNPRFKRNSLVSNFHRNQKEEDEREMCELRARQAERYKRERDKLSDDNEKSESRGNQDGSESCSDNDLINGGDGMVRVKIEGEIRKPQFDTGLVHESQVSKPRHRGAVVGNGSTMKLKERQQVRKKSSVRCWQLECVDLIGYQPHPSLCPRQI